MAKVGQELGLRPKGQLVPYKLYIEMLDGDFTPNWSVDELLSSDYHQGLTALRFAQYLPGEISSYIKDIKAHEMSKGTRTFD